MGFLHDIPPTTSSPLHSPKRELKKNKKTACDTEGAGGGWGNGDVRVFERENEDKEIK